MADFEDNNPFADSGKDDGDSVLVGDLNNVTLNDGSIPATHDTAESNTGLGLDHTPQAAYDFGGSLGGSIYDTEDLYGSRGRNNGHNEPEHENDTLNEHANGIDEPGYASYSIHHKDNSYATSTTTNTTTPRTYTSRVQQILMENPDVEISIVDAGKSHEGNSRGFIAYTIKILDLTIRRRYSEFESLRNNLSRLFPTLIIPPIPEKHSMADYATSPTKAKEDSGIIEHRRRMLAVFLNRCRSMTIIRESEVFQRFLDPNSSWGEVLNTAPLVNLPKSILRAPPLTPAEPTPAHAYLPIPSSSAKLKKEDDPRFADAEQNAKEYEAVIVNGLEKVNKRIVKRYSDMANDYSDLGAKLNAFSLEEDGVLADAIEKVGQAVDNCYISTETLVSQLSSSFSEPLGESAQFAAVVRNVLKYRKQKALQQELTADQLASKRSSLQALEQSEKEAQRINNYLQRDLGESEPATDATSSLGGDDNDSVAAATDYSDSHSTSTFPPTHSVETASGTSKKYTGGFKIPVFSKLNHAIHGIMDVDPESTRRNNIGKTKEMIAQLEQALEVAGTDVVQASDAVKEDLQRFQKTKEEDLRKIMKAYVQCHIEWARNNLESWQEAKLETERM